MQIIPRAESGLAPPNGTPSGPYAKTIIIVHYTCSPNGLLSPASERSIMRSWQLDHESKYNAWDVLQAYSVFQSGRVYENRLWTSNSGAIYNSAGGTVFGWGTHGVGIECQGDFRRPGELMSDLQYQALVFLCRDIYHRAEFTPLPGRFIFGHRELPPCRPSDPWQRGTDCPANLLGQFVTNGKLQTDVTAGVAPVKRREDEMTVRQFDNVTEASWADCWKDKADYYVTTKGTSSAVIFKLTGHKPLGGEGTTIAQSVEGLQDHNIQDILKQDRMKSIKGSYDLTITSAIPITISIREVPK